jgi:hypothetical protein
MEEEEETGSEGVDWFHLAYDRALCPVSTLNSKKF